MIANSFPPDGVCPARCGAHKDLALCVCVCVWLAWIRCLLSGLESWAVVDIFCVSCAHFLEARRGKQKGKLRACVSMCVCVRVCVCVYTLEITVNQQIRSLDTLISTAWTIYAKL